MSARDELIAALKDHACCFTPEDAAQMVDAFAHELFQQTRNGDTYEPASPTGLSDPRPFLELSESGLLWLINRVAFHPRGVALALHEEDGDVLGWSLIAATEGEPFSFPEPVDNDGFNRAEETLRAALTKEQR